MTLVWACPQAVPVILACLCVPPGTRGPGVAHLGLWLPGSLLGGQTQSGWAVFPGLEAIVAIPQPLLGRGVGGPAGPPVPTAVLEAPWWSVRLARAVCVIGK